MSNEAHPARDFEKSVHRLEEIIERLESGDLPLEESIAYFEEGVNLYRGCAETLENAEKRVQKLLETPDGAAEPADDGASLNSGNAP